MRNPKNCSGVVTAAITVGFAGVGGSATISVNDQPIGGGRNNEQPVSFDVTSLLEPTNVLTVDLEYDPQHDGQRGGLWAPVTVEIHEAAGEPASVVTA